MSRLGRILSGTLVGSIHQAEESGPLRRYYLCFWHGKTSDRPLEVTTGLQMLQTGRIFDMRATDL